MQVLGMPLAFVLVGCGGAISRQNYKEMRPIAEMENTKKRMY